MKKIIILLMIFVLNISTYHNIYAQNLSIKFEDVNPDAYYCDSVEYVNEMGIMTGRTSTCFAPDDYLQRQELAVILARHYVRTVNPQLKFNTMNEDYYTAYVRWVKKHQIMNGYENGEFGIGDYITREDFAVAISNYAQRVVGYAVADTGFKEPVIAQFSDCKDVSEYAYIPMFWQTECGVIRGYEIDGIKYIDPKAPVTRGMAAVMLERYINVYNQHFINRGHVFEE